MSDQESDEPIVFRNSDTQRRRAWVDQAVSGARERLRADELARCGEPGAHSRPRLYVIRTSRTG